MVPHSCFADPDSAVLLKADPAAFFNADPDPALKKCVTNYLVKSFPELKRQKNG